MGLVCGYSHAILNCEVQKPVSVYEVWKTSSSIRMPSPVTVAPGCGFGFWYMLGVLHSQKPIENVLCVSGSSLAMVVHLCELNFEDQLQCCSRLRSSMNICNVFRVVRAWLEMELPDDCHNRCSGKMTILLRNVRRGFATESISHWRDKMDLINCLLVACNPIPSYYRDSWYVDCCCVFNATTESRTLPSRTVRYIPGEEYARRLYVDGLRDGHIQSSTHSMPLGIA